MAHHISNVKKKYAAIREDYQKWIAIEKYKGVRMYTDAHIFHELEIVYFLRPTTIEDIVYHRTSY